MPSNIAPHLKSVERRRGYIHAVLSGKTLIRLGDTFRDDLGFVDLTNKNSGKLPKPKGVGGGQLQPPLLFAVQQDVQCDAPVVEFEGNPIDCFNRCDDVVCRIDNARWVHQ